MHCLPGLQLLLRILCNPTVTRTVFNLVRAKLGDAKYPGRLLRKISR